MGSGTIYNLIARVAVLLSLFAIQVTMAHFLKDPRDYGTLGVILSMLAIAYILLSTGLPQAISKFIAQDEENAGAIFKKGIQMQQVVSAMVVVIYVGGIPLWTSLLNDASLTRYILWSAILIPLTGSLQIYLAYLNGKRLFGLQAFFITLNSVSGVIIAFILVFLGMKILGVFLGLIISASITLFVISITTKIKQMNRTYNERPLIHFAIPIILFSMGGSFLLNFDILMLKHFFPDSPIIGYYTGSMSLGKAPFLILYAFSVTVLPSVAKALGDNDFEKARGLVNRNISYLLLLSIPSAMMVLATSEKLLDFVYPAGYAEASGSLGILIFSMSALAVFYSLASIITAMGRPAVSMVIILVCVFVQFGFGLYFIPEFQMKGAAYSNLATVSLGVMASGIVVFKYFRTLFDIKRMIKTVFSSLIIYSLLLHFRNYPIQMLPLVYGLSVLVFSVMMILMGGITKNDIAFVKKLVFS